MSVLLLLHVLLETQMGMHLADMKRFASEDPANRKNQTLPGAHLPAKGFYRIKSANASQHQRQNAFSLEDQGAQLVALLVCCASTANRLGSIQ